MRTILKAMNRCLFRLNDHKFSDNAGRLTHRISNIAASGWSGEIEERGEQGKLQGEKDIINISEFIGRY